ncbi:50S ribosomal protein L7/L12 [Streptococcus oralis]|uniref:50S ribosomal protein L7/L12 n=2 Tax=Streptococcus oralis TaxID=1303 RepID=UPI001EB7F849|nr:50S ribosomal protein L7/L12 [Streptococcus oralis]MBS9407353.1 50S ribosomal protein L7/L12 [Streptococcus oralis]MCP8923241.1 50S ribosomal protein L7/L12 [Streptococcus oralis]
MLAIFIDSIGDKSGTYKLLRNHSPLPFSLIQSRIKDHDAVIEVDMLDLDGLRKVRELIHELSAIGTMVTMRDSTGIITLEFLNNIISTFEEIAAEREELDALMFEEEERLSPFPVNHTFPR